MKTYSYLNDMGYSLTLLIVTVAVLSHLTPQGVNAVYCTISKYSATDIQAAQRYCPEIVINSMKVPAGQTLNLTSLKDGTKVTFKGTITWGYKEWEGPLIRVAGTNITITGCSGHVLDGRGSLWWDSKGGNGGKTKPKFFKANLSYSNINGINIKNSPVQIFSINKCHNLVVQNVNIDNSLGDSKGGHNTDGFNIGDSDSITIKGCTVKNQGDCWSVNSGTNIWVSDNSCSGSRGISIGSVGGRRNNVVRNVTVTNCRISNSDNGVRIKTVYGATGSVSDITYEDITLSNIHEYGILIQGDYKNQGSTGRPTGGVPITGLTVKNVKGTVDSGGVNIYILVKNARNWHFSNINISGGNKKKPCRGIPRRAGVSCKL